LPGDRRGIGRYLREILRVWWERERNRVEVTLIVPQWHTVTVRRRYLREVERRRYRIVSRRYHRRARLDALWFPFNGCSWTDFALPATATLHDASNFVVPDYAPETQSIFRAAAKRCAGLITDSRFSQRELARELQIPESRFVVVRLGVGPPRRPVPIALEVAALEPYVLYVGDAERRKGFDTLLNAMARVATARRDVSLVVTSTIDGWDVPGGVRVVPLGHVDDDTLAALYRSSALLAFPSRYEGFGLPVLEAMSYGAPVVASNAAAVPEAGGDAACYVASDDDAGLAKAMLRVIGDREYADNLRRRGLQQAATFSWERTALETLRVITGTVR
ncbi:MAG: glycosyltransferase family 4 protein, partial [Candidatus Eremiobacteraeota bacterium]|nr:glycosyltransferase family 4 protein [Candidatus Eremiobacteraeota bacterium]